jgi:drug/metabolite transporter (DMT)-like permease
MISAWVAFSCVAALFQTWRTAQQQKLRGQLSVNAAGVVRYLYGVPVGMLFVALYLAAADRSLPALPDAALGFCLVGGVMQILGTNLLIMAFGYRNFAVGTAYSKTEAIQSALVGILLLGEHLSLLSWAGIGVGVGGVLYLSLAGRGTSPAEMLRGVTQPAALCGIGAGFCFGASGNMFRAANQATPGDDPVFKALVILVVVNALQTAIQGAWVAWREPSQLRPIFATWRSSAQVGALSACGSACWFSAFALAPVAMVRAVGQVEMLFTLAFSRFYLKETPRRSDILGALVLVAGVILVLAGAG